MGHWIVWLENNRKIDNKQCNHLEVSEIGDYKLMRAGYLVEKTATFNESEKRMFSNTLYHIPARNVMFAEYEEEVIDNG